DVQDSRFQEKIQLTADKFASKTGDRLIFTPNVFNVLSSVPERYKNRQLPFEIERGFVDEDSYKIILPENSTVDTLQPEVHISNQFGEYHYSIKSDHQN